MTYELRRLENVLTTVVTKGQGLGLYDKSIWRGFVDGGVAG